MARLPRYNIRDLDKDLLELIRYETSDQRKKEIAAEVARDELKAAQEHNRAVLGHVPEHKQFVNGVEGAPFEAIQPRGSILIEFQLYQEMFEYIHDLLVASSPRGDADDPRPGHPGLYAHSHLFLADGRPADPEQPPPQADEYVFVNSVPYSRRIERGWSKQNPEGVYEVTAELCKRRYGNLANIRFGYRDLYAGGLDVWAQTTTLQPKKRTRRGKDREDWLRRQPAIVITVR